MQNCKIFFVELYFSEKLHFQLIVDQSVHDNCLNCCDLTYWEIEIVFFCWDFTYWKINDVRYVSSKKNDVRYDHRYVHDNCLSYCVMQVLTCIAFHYFALY